jgi:threonine dehydrogenase-like Zn-dependent dehydrogenase
MKKAIITGERQAQLVEVPVPQPERDETLVKVHVTPTCTEYKAYLAGRPADYLGHEAAGEVVAVAQPGRVQVGDRVVVQPMYSCGRCSLCIAGDYIHCEDAGAHRESVRERDGIATYAQYLLKSDWLLSPIPEGVSYERASLALCGLGPSFGAFQKMGLDAFDTVLVTGLGPVGLGAVVNARFRGARVIGVESVPYRVGRACEMGAAAVLDPRSETVLEEIRDLTGGMGVDCALDCSGTVAAERLCIDATRRRGQVALVGECSEDLPIRVSPDMIRKGLTVHGSWHYNLSDYPLIMHVIQESPLIDLLVSHVMPMSRVGEAFELSASHTCAKILLEPWQ